MLIWALFAVMTAAAVLFVLYPLLRRPAPAASGEVDGEVSVYRDQLAEIDRDLESGLVGPVEAEAARAEIGRRILRASRAGADTAATPRSRVLPVLAAVLVPVIAVAVYGALGRPNQPDMPLAARQTAAPGGQTIEELVAKVEAHLAANPTDTKGWDVLAPTYMRLGRFDLAAAAWRNAIRTGGPNTRRLDELGRSLTAAADDVITPEARAAFEKSLEIEPSGIVPRFFLAAALSQDGKKEEAVAAWKALVALGKGDEPWLEDARRELADAEAALTGKPAEAPPPPTGPAAGSGSAPAAGPSAADVQTAAQMSPEERAKMIESMVDRLTQRLTASGGSIDEWERLIKAQKLIGRLDAAKASLAAARTAFAGDPESLARLDALTTGLTP